MNIEEAGKLFACSFSKVIHIITSISQSDRAQSRYKNPENAIRFSYWLKCKRLKKTGLFRIKKLPLAYQH